MKSIPKGAFGYTNAHKKRQLLKTILFFLLPIGIFVVGFLTTKTKENYFTIIAVVGSLPACKELQVTLSSSSSLSTETTFCCLNNNKDLLGSLSN